jgi:[protein-PII] uridylyltransferase
VKIVADIPSAPTEVNGATAPPRDLSWCERREWFRARLEERQLASISAEEIEVHFSAMPPCYWERVTEADLIWGLETIHGFLKLIASPQVLATAPFVSWRQTDQPHGARVMLCTWNRHGLLAKAAAAFSAVRLNIVSAQVFTRADNIVLDEFFVTNGDGRTTANEVRMQEMTFLLEGALSEPPRFASVWACSRHKLLATPSAVVPRVTFDNDSSEESTGVQVVAADRLGLLYDILQALADAGLNIKEAHIETEKNLARDTIHVTDARGEKLDPNAFDLLRHKLQTALSLPD